jgi:enamine deaminase RidA (YjgF/YER057c/UK114 family)
MPAIQTRQCFAQYGASALEQAGCTLDDVVRVRYYLTDASLFQSLAPVFGEYFRTARPAATAIVCGLIDPRMKLEVEVLARRTGWS